MGKAKKPVKGGRDDLQVTTINLYTADITALKALAEVEDRPWQVLARRMLHEAIEQAQTSSPPTKKVVI